MTTPEKFKALAGPLDNEYVKQWKQDGGHTAAYFCAHAPEELFWAARILPLRVRGSGGGDTSCADQYLSAVNCSFVRHSLDRLLSSDMDFLDAVLVTNSCDHIRRLYDILNSKKQLALCSYLDIPLVNSSDSRTRLAAQLRTLKNEIEAAFRIEITDDKLTKSIALHNRTRELLARASQLRSARPRLLAGSEMLAMSVAAASMPKDQFNELLEVRLAEVEASAEGSGGATAPKRLLLMGGMLDDPAYVEEIESFGAVIAADQLCCGSKTFSNLADENIDPIQAIADRMLNHPACPRMLCDYQTRLDDLLTALDEHRIDGVICQRLKFCDLWGGEAVMLRRSLRHDRSVPLLLLERDYLTAGTVGQLRTRIQAFLESLD